MGIRTDGQRIRALICCGAIALIAIVGYVDSHVPMIAFSIFYLVPVFLASWYVGRTAGIVMAVASAAFGLAADLFSAHDPEAYAYANSGLRLVLLTVVAITFSRLRQAITREREIAELEHKTADARGDIMRTVALNAQKPLGDITARVVDLGWGLSDSEADRRQIVNELARASEKLSKLVDQLREQEEPVQLSDSSAPQAS
ncbi:MAG: hypothetical protein ACRDHU_01780 [Actinomycetota bacterium]